MKRPAPVLWLLESSRRENRTLRKELRAREQTIDNQKHELAVQKRRASVWRRTALELAPAVSPKAMSVCLMQVESDELADAPEIDDRKRNAPRPPRSLP